MTFEPQVGIISTHLKAARAVSVIGANAALCGPRHRSNLLGRFACMHYPHRISRVKRKRSIGFRARMSTKNGRKLMNRKRAAGRSLNVADKKRGY